MPLELAQGSGSFLAHRLRSIIAELNADLAVKVIGKIPLVFTVENAVPESPDHPVLCVRAGVRDIPERPGQGVKLRTVGCSVYCLIPYAGNNTPANYEMAYRVASDHVLTLLHSDVAMLKPVIDAGLISELEASQADCETLTDIYPYVSADKKLMIHGWYVPFNITFSLTTNYAYP